MDKQTRFSMCLNDMKSILDKNNHKFFLAWGTCLGAIREKKFIQHDHDIDIGILYENYDDSIVNNITNSGLFRLNRTLGKKENSLEYNFIHIKTHIPIDIFIHYRVSENLYYTATFYGICSKKKEGFCKWGRRINGFTTIEFSNNSYDVPSNYHEYLVDCYGEDYMIPKKFSYMSGITNNHYKNLLN